MNRVQSSAFAPQASSQIHEQDAETNLNINIINAVSREAIPFDSSVSPGTLAQIVIGNKQPYQVKVVILAMPTRLYNGLNGPFAKETLYHQSVMHIDEEDKRPTSQFIINDDCTLCFLSTRLPIRPENPHIFTTKNVRVLRKDS